MSDDRVETRVQTPQGELSFQEFFVKERWARDVTAVRFVGAEQASPAPGLFDAIQSAAGDHRLSEQSDHQHRPDSRGSRNSRGAQKRARQSSV